MFSKESLYKFEQDLVKELGFVVPDNNIVISNPSMRKNVWNFDPINNEITASKPEGFTPDEEQAIIEFSMAHEICHMIQSFVMKNDLDKEKVQNLSIDEYNKLLNKFFDKKDICLDQGQLDKFKTFIKDCPFMEKEALKALKFDDFYYVSGDPSAYYDKVYHHNATEIYANHFASSYLYEKYNREGDKSVDFMRAFGDKIKERTNYLSSDRATITKDEFKEQILRSKRKWQINLMKIMNLFGKFKDLSPVYKNHDFTTTAKRLNGIVKQMEAIKEEIPKIYQTPQEIAQEQANKQKCKERIEAIDNAKPVTVIDDFIPGEQNKGRYRSYPKDNYEALANFAESESLGHFNQEIVVDIKNKMVHVFYEKRLDTDTMRESDNILGTENLRDKLEKLTEVAIVGLQLQPAR